MSEEDDYFRAGEALSSILNRWQSKIKEGMSLISIAEDIEKEIMDMGMKPAFPVNLSMNEIAAHYTPFPSDRSYVQKGSVLKLDAGIVLNGCIVDAARTICFNDSYKKISDVAREAFYEAVKVMKPGARIMDVSRAIYESIKNGGMKPIKNLAGHKITKYKLHSGIDIPNYISLSLYKLKPGDVFAVEPFVTTFEGEGIVLNDNRVYIFSFKKNVRTSSSSEKTIMRLAQKQFMGLPFCERWVKKEMGKNLDDRDIAQLLRVLAKKGGLYDYPVLVEARGMPVAQYENTVMITEDGAVILTEKG
ncbi:MAG: type II methionyl aminopeptidase [Candidatus Methanodesulfokora sp.]|jgi:methionyl aminopeptidase